ncbi:hypothetical protein SGRIM128S_06957 [Streptomyces griseomycini]
MASSTTRTSGWVATWHRVASRSPSTSMVRTTRLPCMKNGHDPRLGRVLVGQDVHDLGLGSRLDAWRVTPGPTRASVWRPDFAASGVSGRSGWVSRRTL